MSEPTPIKEGADTAQPHNSVVLAFIRADDSAKFTRKKSKMETEAKIEMPASWFETNEQADTFMRNLVGSGALLGPEVKSVHKIRAILDTDDLDIMNDVGGFLTLTYGQEGQTWQRFKTRDLGSNAAEEVAEEIEVELNESIGTTESDADFTLVRKERKAEIHGRVAHPVFEAIKNDKLRAQLEELGDDIKVQGIMDYTSHKAEISVDGINVSVSLDRVTLYSRFADVKPIEFAELELDTLHTGKKAKRVIEGLAEKIASTIDDKNVRIITTPKEERLLTNPEFTAKLAEEHEQDREQVIGTTNNGLSEDEAFVLAFLKDWQNDPALTATAETMEDERHAQFRIA